jgi:gamma-glutamyl hercynylcysteine S-oxide synthase
MGVYVAKRRKIVLLILSSLIILSAFVSRSVHRTYLLNRSYAEPPEAMVLVPAGDTQIGTDNDIAGDDEKPLRTAFLPAFYIDTHEVTNVEFQKFDPKFTFDEGKDNYPVTGITLQRARDYAASVGKRLPRISEWEKAARGTDGRDYTWGNDFQFGLANVGNGDALEPIGQHPKSVSPYGVHDMIGNAWEWVDDDWRDSGIFGFGKQGISREVIKGGAFSYGAYQARASYNGYEGIGGTCNDVGFRCVLDAK